MTVAELLIKLQQMDPACKVYYSGSMFASESETCIVEEVKTGTDEDGQYVFLA